MWNPVKELKDGEIARAKLVGLPWNPVKELKVNLTKILS